MSTDSAASVIVDPITGVPVGVILDGVVYRLQVEATVVNPITINGPISVDGYSGELALESTLSSLNAKLNSLGQKLSDFSVPVVIASDQSPIPVTGGGGGGGSSTEYQEDVAAPANPLGGALIGRRRDSLTSETNTDGDWVALNSTNKGELYVKHIDSITVDGYVGLKNNNAFVSSDNPLPISVESLPLPSGAATSLLQGSIFDLDTGAGNELVSGVSLRKSASGGSVELGTLSDPIRIDPTGTTTQPISSIQLPNTLVSGRLDVNLGSWFGSTAPTVGQKSSANSIPVVIASDQSGIAVTNSTLAVIGGGTEAAALRVTIANDSTGLLSIDDNGGSITVDGSVNADIRVDGSAVSNGNPVPISDAGSSITVDGTVTANAGTGTFVVDQINAAEADYDTGGGTVNQVMFGLALPGSGGPVAGGTNTNPVRIDPTGSTAQPVTDNGGSLTIDNSTLSVVGGGAEATALRVTIANDSTGVLSIDDNGGSLTVDGAVTVSGTVDTELTTADLDTGAGTDTRAVVGLVYGASGGGVLVSTSNPMPIGDNGGSITVDGTVAVTDGGGSLTIDTAQLPGSLISGRLDTNVGSWLGSTAPTVGQKTLGDSIPVVIASDQTVIPISDNGGSLTVDGTVTVTQTTASNLKAQIEGTEAHDAAATVNPVTISGRGSDAIPTPVSADGDVARIWVDRRGAIKTSLVDSTGDSIMDDTNNAIRVNIVAGGSGGGGGGTQYTEDLPSAGGELLTLAGAVRQDTLTITTSDNGDYTNLKTDSFGKLWVNAGDADGYLSIKANGSLISSTNPLPVSVTFSNPSVGLIGGATPTSATLIGTTDGSSLQTPYSYDLHTGLGVEYVLGTSIRLPGASGSVIGGTSANPFRIDPTGTTAQPITDNNGSITIDGYVSANLMVGNVDVSSSNPLPISAAKSDNTNVTSVPASITNVTLLSANSSRKGAAIFNDAALSILTIKLGAVASATSFTVRVSAGGFYEVPEAYTGQIDGLWSIASGAARITEII